MRCPPNRAGPSRCPWPARNSPPGRTKGTHRRTTRARPTSVRPTVTWQIRHPKTRACPRFARGMRRARGGGTTRAAVDTQRRVAKAQRRDAPRREAAARAARQPLASLPSVGPTRGFTRNKRHKKAKKNNIPFPVAACSHLKPYPSRGRVNLPERGRRAVRVPGINESLGAADRNVGSVERRSSQKPVGKLFLGAFT
jgi:hypothetical protein